MSTFYHYTSKNAWDKIKQEGTMSRNRRMITLGESTEQMPFIATDGAIFGLVTEQDPKWCKEEYNIDRSVLGIVLGDINTGQNQKLALLKINTAGLDNVFVADWGVHLADDYFGSNTRHTPQNVINRVKNEYANSLIPFDEYNDQMNYRLPEVVCFSDIPVQNIDLIWVNYLNKYRNQLCSAYNKETLPASWETPARILPCEKDNLLRSIPFEQRHQIFNQQNALEL